MKTQTQSNVLPALKKIATLGACLSLLLMAEGCARTKVTGRAPVVTEQLPRPATIWVCDFSATPADVPADSELAKDATLDTTPLTAEEINTGRQLGMDIAAQLIDQIRGMGLTASRGTANVQMQANDIVLRGYLLSIKEGSTAKRVAVGFGSGGSELRTLVEGFQVTPGGFRKLGSGTVQAGSAKGPGGAVGAATWIATGNPAGFIVGTSAKLYGEASGKSKIEGRAKSTAKEISDVLKERFKKEGWIN